MQTVHGAGRMIPQVVGVIGAKARAVGMEREGHGLGLGYVRGVSHISGSFCVSMTAASGMPKLEAGPQKSDRNTSCQRVKRRADNSVRGNVKGEGRLEARERVIGQAIEGCAVAKPWCAASGNCEVGGVIQRTGRTEIIQRLVGADFGVDSFDSGGHDGRRGEAKGEGAGEGEVVRGRSGVGLRNDFTQRRSSEGRRVLRLGPATRRGATKLLVFTAKRS